MPNTVIFSESLEGLSLRKGDFYLGTGDVGKGPTSVTGFYNGIPVGNYSYVIYLRRITNIFPRSGTTLAFTSAYNGTNYTFGAGTNLQQEFQDNLRPESTTRVTKVSRINSNVSQRDYVHVGLSSPLNSTRIVSFWYYGTYGSQIQVYNNDGSANLSYLNSSKNWVAGSTTGFRYVNIPVTINVWQKIVVRIVNSGTAGTGWSWTILHNNVATPTLANTEYWAFSEFIYEEKPINGFAKYPCQDDAELILRTNQIDKSVVRTTKDQCFSYFAGQSDKMIVNKDYDTLITNGIKFFLDASFLPSYPATGSTWYDLGDSGKNGTLENGAVYYSDGSIDLDGTNDYISTTYGKDINPFNNPLTITVVIKPDDLVTNQMFISTGQTRGNAVSDQRFYIAIYGGNWDWGIRTSSWSSGNIVANTRWNEITICVDSTSARFYLNGSQIYTKSVNNTYVLNDNFWFGAHDSGGNFPFNGRISSVDIYNRAILGTEILQNYYRGSLVTSGLLFSFDSANLISYPTSGTTAFSMTGSNTLTLANGVGFDQKYGGRWLLDGSNDRLDSNFTDIIDSVTIECWYRGTKTTRNHLWNFGVYPTTNFHCNFNDSGIPLWFYWNGNGSTRLWFTQGNFTDGTIKHLVFTHVGSDNQAYLNGQLLTAGRSTSGTQTFSNVNSGGSFNVGGSAFFGGDIYQVRIYNRALSSSEILQNFNAHKSRYGL